jgi:anti-sigma factor RsiW
MDEHATMCQLIDRYTSDRELSGDDWLRLKRHLATCAACAGYMAAAQRLEGELAYRPALDAPLGFVNAVLRSLPPMVAPVRHAWRSRALVFTLAVAGLALMLVPDTYLLNQLASWLGDLGSAVSNAGQGLSDWASDPSLGGSDFASELFNQHQTVLLGLCILTIALVAILFQALTAPLPAPHHARRTTK